MSTHVRSSIYYQITGTIAEDSERHMFLFKIASSEQANVTMHPNWLVVIKTYSISIYSHWSSLTFCAHVKM